jgi:hypothetical protein
MSTVERNLAVKTAGRYGTTSTLVPIWTTEVAAAR